MTIRVSATAAGPILDGLGPERVKAAVADIVREVTELGMQRLTAAFPTGVPVKTGNYRRNIHPTILGAQAQLDDSGVIYGPWLEGTGSRNETTRFKGYSTFRRAAQYLQDEVVPEVVARRAEQLATELGG